MSLLNHVTCVATQGNMHEVEMISLICSEVSNGNVTKSTVSDVFRVNAKVGTMFGKMFFLFGLEIAETPLFWEVKRMTSKWEHWP